MTPGLERITTQYVAQEDRVRLTGQTPEGTPVVIWLSMRMLQRLLPPLFKWLEQQGPASTFKDLRQGFAQQAARAELQATAPVRAKADSQTWLAHGVDIAYWKGVVRLTFKAPGEEDAILRMPVKPLRQWLGIVYEAYRKAEWPLQVWPDWVREASASPKKDETVLH